MKETNLREHLINISYEEIYTKGFQSANTTEILKKANINKGSMYHYFKSKKSLGLSVINEKLNDKIIKKYEPLRLIEKDALSSLINLLNNTKIINFKYGCPVNNLIQEMAPLDDEFKQSLERIYKYMEESIEEVLKTAVKNEEISSYHDTKKLSMFVLSCMEGSIITAKKSNSKKDYEDSISVLIQYLENLRK